MYLHKYISTYSTYIVHLCPCFKIFVNVMFNKWMNSLLLFCLCFKLTYDFFLFLKKELFDFGMIWKDLCNHNVYNVLCWVNTNIVGCCIFVFFRFSLSGLYPKLHYFFHFGRKLFNNTFNGIKIRWITSEESK